MKNVSKIRKKRGKKDIEGESGGKQRGINRKRERERERKRERERERESE